MAKFKVLYLSWGNQLPVGEKLTERSPAEEDLES